MLNCYRTDEACEMKLEYVLFDCWDTVIRFGLKKPDGNLHAIYSHITDPSNYPFEQFKADFLSFMHDYYAATIYDVSAEAILAYIIEKREKKLDCGYVEAVKEAAQEYDASIIPGLKDFCAYLASRNIKCSVLSNTIHSQEITAGLIKRAWDDHPFEQIICSSTYAVKKPDARFFELGAIKVNHRPENIIFIGDNIHTDIRGASQAGLAPFWFNWKGNLATEEDVEGINYREISSYKELSEILENERHNYGF